MPLTFKIEAIGLKPVLDLCEVLKTVLQDERIDEEIRGKYSAEVMEILSREEDIKGAVEKLIG